jgi:hypothetical protein
MQEQWATTVMLLAGVLGLFVCVGTWTTARRLWRDDVVRQAREVVTTRAEYKDRLRVMADKYAAAKKALVVEQRRQDAAAAAIYAEHAAQTCALQAELHAARAQVH